MTDRLERELAALERRVLRSERVAGWLAAVDKIRAMLESKPDDVKLAVLALVAPKVEAAALAGVVDAFGLARGDALRVLAGRADDAAEALSATPSRQARGAVRGLDAAGAAAVARAQRLARGGADAATIASPLLGHARSVRATVSDSLTRAASEGVTEVARVAEVPLVWIAETNACVHCLAYSGRVAEPGEGFPPGLTYGRKPLPGDVQAPPRHPNCRCTMEPLVSQDFADALRREADRSVLRGFSLESESMAVRIDAAERLLERGVDAPKTVLQFSRRAVRDGRFPTRGRP